MRQLLVWGILCAALTTASLLTSQEASAQSATSYAAGNMWGTAPSGVAVDGAVDSALAHNENALVAGAVNASRAGLLVGNGSSISISSVGSQSIVSNTIIGDGNSSNISADQSSSNSGNTSNNGTITGPLH